LRTVAFDTEYGLKDIGMLFGAESVPCYTDDAVDAAPTHAISARNNQPVTQSIVDLPGVPIGDSA